MSRKTTQQIEHQARVQHLAQLLKDHQRQQTIQDVGFWLIEYPLEPLTPRLIEVLRQWLKEHNNLTIRQNRRGSPHSDTRDLFPLISRMHAASGIPVDGIAPWTARVRSAPCSPAINTGGQPIACNSIQDRILSMDSRI
jgi:hypothetical protein